VRTRESIPDHAINDVMAISEEVASRRNPDYDSDSPSPPRNSQAVHLRIGDVGREVGGPTVVAKAVAVAGSPGLCE